MTITFRSSGQQVMVASNKFLFPLPLFPTTNLIFNFSALSGTSTTTNGATIATWTDARTGLVAYNYAGGVPLTYHTDITINSIPTLTGFATITYGNRTTPQNSWTWYGVVRFGTGGIVGSLIINTNNTNNTYTVRVVYDSFQTFKPCQTGIVVGPGPASSSGGPVNSWVPQINTNYIFSYICTGSSPNSTTSTQTYKFRINGVDYTPSANTDTGYYYIYNMGIGNDSTNTCYTGEQILYSTNHSLATAQTMEQYLSNKWQIPIGGASTPASSSPYIN